jgi:hypothetical protein
MCRLIKSYFKILCLIYYSLHSISAFSQISNSSKNKIEPFRAYYSKHTIPGSLNNQEQDVNEPVWMSVNSWYLKDSLVTEILQYDSYHKLIETRRLYSDGSYTTWTGDNVSPLIMAEDRKGKLIGILIIKGKLISLMEGQYSGGNFTMKLDEVSVSDINNTFYEVELSFNQRDYFSLDQLLAISGFINKEFSYPITETESKKFTEQYKYQLGNAPMSDTTVFYRFVLIDENQNKIRTKVKSTQFKLNLKTSFHIYHEGDWLKNNISANLEPSKQISSVGGVPNNKLNVPSINTTTKSKDVDDLIKEQMLNRNNKYMGIVETSLPHVEIKLYDNQMVDRDTVSLFHNDNLVLPRKMISKKPLTYKVLLDTKNSEHRIVLFANNLGDIPPNSSMMIIDAGPKRFRLYPSTDFGNNIYLLIRYNPNLGSEAIFKE